LLTKKLKIVNKYNVKKYFIKNSSTEIKRKTKEAGKPKIAHQHNDKKNHQKISCYQS
jgi:hypothetical protein